jgi:ATP-dependent DNA ligase
MSIEYCLDVMEKELVTRNTTGNAAIDLMHNLLVNSSNDNTDILLKILKRDLRIGVNRSTLKKVFKGLISAPVYMRCDVYSKKTSKKINPENAVIQLKADGTYREFLVENGVVSSVSRSGEVYEYPIHFDILKNAPDGHYFGELTVVRNGITLPRQEGNGLISSDEVPHEDIVYDVWDYVTLEEYTNAVNKVKNKEQYSLRLSKLIKIMDSLKSDKVKLIETYEISSIKEALEYVSKWMSSGKEGGILKDLSAVFKDGTNQQQLKIKLVIDADVRITGFKEGTPGTVREKTFGAILFETDDGKVKGQCSGFTDDQLEDFNSRRNELMGSIMSVTFNDLMKSRDNDYYSLSHPRFSELRNDKNETDDLNRILKLREMAMELA